MGLDLGSRLALHVAPTLEIQLERVFLWSDSTTALDWTNIDEKRLQTFVKNRYIAIRERIPLEQIRWVPGHLNPADAGTRGLSPQELKKYKMWLSGPDFFG